jgi:hypothetical protein
MNLANYFLADLPPEATLSPGMITEACQVLKRNREQYLAGRTTEQQVKLLCRLAEEWQDPASPFRQMALAEGPGQTGFARVDELVGDLAEAPTTRTALAVAPPLLAHITAGNVPNPTLMSMVLGVLTRSAQFVKCASGAAFLPRLFAHSLYEADAKLGACLEVADWRGGHAALEHALFAEADCVTATGSDETLRAIRARLPLTARFLGYGHRVSFGLVTGEALPSGFQARQVAARAADDVVAWNQLGCLSPHVIYVLAGGVVSAEQFAELLAAELEKREVSEPRGELPLEAAVAIATRRGFYEVRAAHAPSETRHWCSRDSTAWTVIYETDPQFQVSCLNRFVYVKAVANFKTLLENLESIHDRVSTVGLAATGDQAPDFARSLARRGVLRLCPLGRMQDPPLTWRHDGRPALADLVTWRDWEMR